MNNSTRVLVFLGLFFSCIAHSQVPVAPADGNVNADMNWVMTKSYDAQGNVTGMTKNFFDNSGKTLQTQTKNMTYGHVLAAQPLLDAQGRPAATTLLAPINNSEFRYKSDFVLNGSSTVYNYKNFDRYYTGVTGQDKTNSPDAVGGQTQVGTLGWYYGTSNNWEPYTPTTDYPYNRTEYFNDGSGAQKKASGAGEAFRMGSTHEGFGYVVPVASELDFYMQVKNKYFPLLGDNGLPSSLSTLQGQGAQEIIRDANGRYSIMIKDKGGKVLMTGRPGTGGITVSNSVSLNGYPYVFKIQSSFADVSTNWIRIKGGGNGRIRLNGNIIYTGSLNGYINGCLDWNTCPAIIGEIIIESTLPFYTTYSASYPGGGTSNYCDQCPAESNTVPAHYYFAMLSSGNVTVSGSSDFQFINQETEQIINPLPPGQTGTFALAAGYYRLLVNSGETTLAYDNSYTDISFNFYNQRRQLVGSIAPEGVKKLIGTGINNYAAKTDLPFTMLMGYDLKDRLISSQDGDSKKVEFVYRKDGKLRFSQNGEQRLDGRYTYTNYDLYGRALEAGEYKPAGGGIAFNADMGASINPMRDILEDVSNTGGLINGARTFVTRTIYDVEDYSFKNASRPELESYFQTFVKGAVSVSEKLDDGVTITSKSWRSYDEQGKITWGIKYISGLGYKTTDNTYDPLGKLIKNVYQKGISSEMFVHYYEYNANQELSKIYTHTEDNFSAKMLQVSYTYFLHGGVKRSQLASDLQGIDYTYTLQGTLKAVNNNDKTKDPGGDGANGVLADAFGMVLDYFANDYVNPRAGIQPFKAVNTSAITTDSYTGQIKAMTWFSKKPIASGIPDDAIVYIYKYDNKYQFTESVWGNAINFANTPATFTLTGFNKESVYIPSTSTPAYDANGNINYLQRTNGSGTTTDKFTYNYFNTVTGTGSNTIYNTNKLQSVTHDNNGTPQTYASYIYNDLGQLIIENAGIGSTTKYIKYDVSGKVIAVARDAGFAQKIVEYVYDEMGTKIIKKSYNTSYQLIQNTYYVGEVIYTQPVSGGTPGATLVQEYELNGGSGRVGIYFRQPNIYAYGLIDQLGNTRAVIAKSGSTLDVRSYSDFYPYGMVVREYKSSEGYRYGYQGKYAEKEGETDWNAFELRMYDSRIGRWLTTDPQDEFSSPYVAMGNDPANLTDPDGGDTKSTDVRRNNDGSFTVVNAFNDNDRNIYVVDAKGKRTSEIIGTTLGATDFMTTNERNGGFHFDATVSGLTFRMDQLTISGTIHPNAHTTKTINSADLARFVAWGVETFKEEVARQSPATFYGELEILRDMSQSYDPKKTSYEGSLDFKYSMGLNPYTPIRVGGPGSTFITTLRAASNIVFGKNMRVTYPRASITPEYYYRKVMEEVGKYNQTEHGGNGYNNGWPYFGEHTYSGRYIYFGYFGKFPN